MVNSKADKKHAHSVKAISIPGITPGSTTKPTSYSASAPSSGAPPASGLSQAGQKALALRAKKVLAPLADPSQSIT